MCFGGSNHCGTLKCTVSNVQVVKSLKTSKYAFLISSDKLQVLNEIPIEERDINGPPDSFKCL